MYRNFFCFFSCSRQQLFIFFCFVFGVKKNRQNTTAAWYHDGRKKMKSSFFKKEKDPNL